MSLLFPMTMKSGLRISHIMVNHERGLLFGACVKTHQNRRS
jgi:hypothetical protein